MWDGTRLQILCGCGFTPHERKVNEVTIQMPQMLPVGYSMPVPPEFIFGNLGAFQMFGCMNLVPKRRWIFQCWRGVTFSRRGNGTEHHLDPPRDCRLPVLIPLYYMVEDLFATDTVVKLNEQFTYSKCKVVAFVQVISQLPLCTILHLFKALMIIFLIKLPFTLP